MKRISGFLLVLFMLGSCSEANKQPVQDDIIPKPLLIKVMIDLEIMEAYYEQVHKRPQIYKTTLDSASKEVLRSNGVTEVQLRQSLGLL